MVLIEQHKNTDNIITLDENLHIPFMENKFGIDVEVSQHELLFLHMLQLSTTSPRMTIRSLSSKTFLRAKNYR